MDHTNKEVDGSDRKGQNNSVSVLREVFSWIMSFVLAFVAAFLIKHYLIINADVPTGSMENTIIPGDRLIGNRLAYLKDDPDRGDIVIFRFPDDEKELYVKRVIGLPGETVAIENGKIYINGAQTPLAEDYLKDTWEEASGPYLFEIPEDSYLMLGDNRNDSYDSRYWSNTYVKREKILARAAIVYWPLRDFGKLE